MKHEQQKKNEADQVAKKKAKIFEILKILWLLFVGTWNQCQKLCRCRCYDDANDVRCPLYLGY